MTEDIGSDKHRRPSNSEIDVAKLKERHLAVVSEMADMKDMLRAHMEKSEQRHNELMRVFNDHKTEDAVVHSAVVRNTVAIEELQADRRGPVAIILATLAAIGAGVAAFWGK